MISTHRQTSNISIIIPVLNEENNIASLAVDLADSRCEVIVVDGGSTDGTVELARRHHLKVVQSEPGRGRQLNLGATQAQGEILLFLHADTRLPLGFEEAVRQAMTNTSCIAGAFRLAVDKPSRAMRFIAHCANLRSSLLHLPYGDQAIFTRKEDFDRLQGFPDLPIMEDYAFIKNAQKQGEIVLLKEYVITSARRWQRKGVLRTTCINQLMVLGYLLKIPPEKLVLLYDR